MSKKKPYVRLKPKLDPAGEGYPEPMRRLLYLGKPKQGMSRAELAEQLRDYVPQLIQMTLDRDLNERPEKDKAVWAPLHALRVLIELAPVEAVEPLLNLLDEHDDWTGDELIAFYAAAGAPAVGPLAAYVRDSGRTLDSRVIAVSALGAVGQQHADLRDQVVRFLTAMLEQSADGPESHGAHSAADEETVLSWAIVELAQLKAAEALPAIRTAFEDDRVDTFIASLKDVERLMLSTGENDADVQDFGDEDDEVVGEQPLTLTLKCKACGREREYTFERAYYDLGTVEHHGQTQDTPLIIPERVVCRKCGAVDQYELGALSQFAVLAKIMGEPSGLPDPLPGLEIVNLTSERWGWVPPRQLLPRYEAEIAGHPDDHDLRMGYANALRTMGYPEQARVEYERLLMADPDNGDVLFALAQMASEFDGMPEAIKVWEQLERRFDELRLPPEERELRHQEVEDVLAELRSGKRPRYYGKRIPIDDEGGPDRASGATRPLPEPPALPAPTEPIRPASSPYGKVGRNDPCPCGSGKKYKQCHGRK